MSKLSPEPLVEPVPGAADRVVGRRLIRTLEEQLARLDTPAPHGNRTAGLRHVVVAHLLAFFNPTLESLRRIEDLAESPTQRRRLGLPRLPKSTLSDAQRLFDPARLTPLIDTLKNKLAARRPPPGLDALTLQLRAVDGSFFPVATRILWAIHGRSPAGTRPANPGHVRLDVHLDVCQGVPLHASLTGGQRSEHGQLAEQARPGGLYLLDRGFQSFATLARLRALGSDFVVRWRKDLVYEVVAERPLSAADRAHGVRGDRDIRIPGHRARPLAGQTLRLVQLQPPDGAEPLYLLTSLTSPAAELIGVLYRQRWQVELFFRWLKGVVKFRHFLSESPTGMTLQIYAALIGTLLIALETQSPPSVYSYALMTQVMHGQLPLAEARQILERRRQERARAAAWQKEYNARRAAAAPR